METCGLILSSLGVKSLILPVICIRSKQKKLFFWRDDCKHELSAQPEGKEK